MASSLKKSGFLVLITLVLCLDGRCEAGILSALQRNYQKRLAMISRSSKAHKPASAGTSYVPVHHQLHRGIDISGLGLNTTFGDAIDILRNSTEPPLNIVVLWRDLSENANIDRDTPIQIEGVEGIKAGFALELLLSAVSSRSAKLGYVVQGSAIIIATRESLPARRFVRVYDIRDLAAGPADFGFGMGPYLGWGRMPGAGGWMNGMRRGYSGSGLGNYSRENPRRRR